MTEETKKFRYAPTFTLRLTPEERAKLDAAAGSQTIGDYIREQLFDVPSPCTVRRCRPVQDEQLLSAVLAGLGQSRLSSNLNQIAKAIHSGSYPVSPEAEMAILAACTDIRAMRNNITQALGFPPPEARS